VSAAYLGRTISIDESSVYRNLEVLERQGLIRHVHLGHGPGLYALIGRHDVEYLYCERCAKVTAVTPDELDPVRRRIKERFGYEARFTHFAIVGLCEGCAADPSPTADPSGVRSSRSGGLHTHGSHAHSHPASGPGP
jgi:Fe2+ or Zn2+ uptake regulation protein